MIDHALFVATIGEGVFKRDNGASFRRACDGMEFVECDVRALVADPDEQATLYLGNEEGVWVSRDAAETWNQLLKTDGSVWSLHVLGKRIIAGTCPPTLLRSEDGGSSWTRTEATITPDCPRIRHTRVTCIAADPENAERLYAGVEIDGIFASEDDGRSWRGRGEGLSSRDIHSLLVLPGGRMLATTNNDLNSSDDGGKNWHNWRTVRQSCWAEAIGLRAGRGRLLARRIAGGRGRACCRRWRTAPSGTSRLTLPMRLWCMHRASADRSIVRRMAVERGRNCRWSSARSAGWHGCHGNKSGKSHG
jgi:photosystem II stability/assembly factor-like uncharacterized protein